MNNYYVYFYYESGSNVPLYVGKGFGNRLSHHVKPGVVHGGKGPFYDKLRQLLESGFSPQIQVVAANLSEKEAWELEKYFISRFGRRDLGTGCLFNQTDGGPGKLNPSPVARGEMSERASNLSERIRRKISEYHSGRSKSADHRKKIGAANKGKTRTEATRKKISDAKRADPCNAHFCRQLAVSQRIPIEAVDPLTDQVVFVFPSQRAAHQVGYNQGAVSQCLHGQRLRYKGLLWRFAG